MKRFVRDLRLIPIALIASACLLTLKTADLFFHGSLFLSNSNAPSSNGEVAIIRPMPDATQPPGSALSWAQQMFNFPNSDGASPSLSPVRIAPPQLAENDSVDITGSVSTEPATLRPATVFTINSVGINPWPVDFPSSTLCTTSRVV